MPLYPDITVSISPRDDIVEFLIGQCVRKMRDNGCSQSQIDLFVADTLEESYDKIVSLCKIYFTVTYL